MSSLVLWPRRSREDHSPWMKCPDWRQFLSIVKTVLPHAFPRCYLVSSEISLVGKTALTFFQESGRVGPWCYSDLYTIEVLVTGRPGRNSRTFVCLICRVVDKLREMGHTVSHLKVRTNPYANCQVTCKVASFLVENISTKFIIFQAPFETIKDGISTTEPINVSCVWYNIVLDHFGMKEATFNAICDGKAWVEPVLFQVQGMPSENEIWRVVRSLCLIKIYNDRNYKMINGYEVTFASVVGNSSGSSCYLMKNSRETALEVLGDGYRSYTAHHLHSDCGCDLQVQEIIGLIIDPEECERQTMGVAGSAALSWFQNFHQIGPKWKGIGDVDIFVFADTSEYFEDRVARAREMLLSKGHVVHSDRALFSHYVSRSGRPRKPAFIKEFKVLGISTAFSFIRINGAYGNDNLGDVMEDFDIDICKVAYLPHGPEGPYFLSTDSIVSNIRDGIAHMAARAYCEPSYLHRREAKQLRKSLLRMRKYSRRGFKIVNGSGVFFSPS